MAVTSALVPSGSVSLTSAPAATSASIVSMCPWRAANSSGVQPKIDRSVMLAPASSSSFTVSALPSCAAHISAVCCFQRSGR